VIGPEIEVPGDEFAAVIDTNGGGVTNLPTYAFRRLDHILAPLIEACIDRRREARKGIDNRQNPDLTPRGQLVVNEVHRPDMVGMGRLRAASPQLCLDPTLGNLVAEL